MALRSARLNGAPIPKEVIDMAVGYVRRTYSPNHGFGYTGAGASTCMSAVGALCLEMCGYHGDPATKVAGQRILNATSPNGGIAWEGGAAVPGRVEYTVYYCTNAMFQIGGQFWDQFASRMYTGILASQGRDGSWGGIYGTSIKILCLTVTYRQMPIHQR